MPTANCEFKITGWDEEAFSKGDGLPTLKRAKVSKGYTGDLSGEGQLEYLMTYLNEREAVFCGYERFTGSLGEKQGTFVIYRNGRSRADGIVEETFLIVEGSGTSELASISGEGRWEGDHAESYPLAFEYDL